MTRESIGIYEGDANIFADLGRPDAEVHFLKAQIVAELYRCSTERQLTEARVAELLGVPHRMRPDCSKASSASTPLGSCSRF